MKLELCEINFVGDKGGLQRIVRTILKVKFELEEKVLSELLNKSIVMKNLYKNHQRDVGNFWHDCTIG